MQTDIPIARERYASGLTGLSRALFVAILCVVIPFGLLLCLWPGGTWPY